MPRLSWISLLFACLFAATAAGQDDASVQKYDGPDQKCDDHVCQKCQGEHEKHVYVFGRPHHQGKGGEPEAGGEPEGGFAAPPRSGTTAGETRALGIEGPSIEFPALKLKLPSLRLPALTKYRTGPRMLIDEDVAPFQRDVRTEYTFPAGQESGADRRGPDEPESAPDVPTPPADVPTQKTDALQKHQSQQKNLLAPPTIPVGDIGREYDQRLSRLEDMERRLDSKLVQISTLLQNLSDRQDKLAPAQPAASPQAPQDSQPRPLVEGRFREGAVGQTTIRQDPRLLPAGHFVPTPLPVLHEEANTVRRLPDADLARLPTD